MGKELDANAENGHFVEGEELVGVSTRRKVIIIVLFFAFVLNIWLRHSSMRSDLELLKLETPIFPLLLSIVRGQVVQDLESPSIL